MNQKVVQNLFLPWLFWFHTEFCLPIPSNRQHLSSDACLGIRGKIIRTALCCVVYDSCAQWCAHAWAVLAFLHVRFRFLFVWQGRTSPKWCILCRVGRKTSTQSTKCCHSFIIVIHNYLLEHFWPYLMCEKIKLAQFCNYCGLAAFCLCLLVCLYVASMLERLLDSKLKEEESKQPLKLPSPDQYR